MWKTSAVYVLWVVISFCASPASAQEQVGSFELYAGVGYANGGGTEAPSLPSVTVGFAVWPRERQGFAVDYVRGLGEESYSTPSTSIDPGDTVLVSRGGLQYFRVTFRYRRPLRSLRADLHVGMGVAIGGQFEEVVAMGMEGGLREIRYEHSFRGIALDLFLGRSLGDRLTIKGGVTLDGGFDSTVLVPLVLASVSF